jgi:hypothetical protein
MLQAIIQTCLDTGIITVSLNTCAFILLCTVIMRVEMHRLIQPVRLIGFSSNLQYAESDCVDLVGSTLSDPYLAYSAALFALAGPLHGFGLLGFFVS